MKKLFDMNGIELKKGDIVSLEDGSNKSVVFINETTLGLTNYESTKGTIFLIDNFICEETKSSILLLEYKKVQS